MKNIKFDYMCFKVIVIATLFFSTLFSSDLFVHANENFIDKTSPSIKISTFQNSKPLYFSIDEETFYGPFTITGENIDISSNDAILLSILEDFDYGISLVGEDFSSKRNYILDDTFYIKIPKSLNSQLSSIQLETSGVQNIITASLVEDIYFSNTKELQLIEDEIHNSVTLSTSEIPETYNYPIFAFNNGKEDEYQEESFAEHSKTISSNDDFQENIYTAENTQEENYSYLDNLFSEEKAQYSNIPIDSYILNQEIVLSKTIDDAIMDSNLNSNQAQIIKTADLTSYDEEKSIYDNTLLAENENTDVNNLLDKKENPETSDTSTNSILIITAIYIMSFIASFLLAVRSYIIRENIL